MVRNKIGLERYTADQNSNKPSGNVPWSNNSPPQLEKKIPKSYHSAHVPRKMTHGETNGNAIISKVSVTFFCQIRFHRDGAVMKALASHQCGPGSIPSSGVKCGLTWLVLYSALRGFLRELRFPLSSKTKI